MLIKGLRQEWQEREHKLLKELDAAKATISNKDERDRCYLAYCQLFDGVRDEMQQLITV